MLKNKQQIDYSIKIDILNPGHYYAACGLLELESLNNPETVGWFDTNLHTFSLYNFDAQGERLNIRTTLQNLAKSKIEKEESNLIDKNGKIKKDNDAPLNISGKFNIQLNWWKEYENSNFKYSKTWAGNQNAHGQVKSLIPHLDIILDDIKAEEHNLLNEEAYHNTSTFIDARMRAQELLNTSDISDPTNERIKVQPFRIFPFVELLGFFGFQKFRPDLLESNKLSYSLWKIPLHIDTASVVSSIQDNVDFIDKFEFNSMGRAGGRYKYYTYGSKLQL